MDIGTFLGQLLLLVGQSFWIMFPAYVSGSAAVLFKGQTPMDYGKSWRGRRIFGDGKTWEGFLMGGLTGVFAGSMQQLVCYLSGRPYMEAFGLRVSGTFDPDGWALMSLGALAVTACLSYGGLVGDLIKSFIKRRLGLDRGTKSPFLMDQLDFVLGAWLVTVPLFWFWFSHTFGLFNIVIILVMAPMLHRATNIIGYKLGAKKEPW